MRRILQLRMSLDVAKEMENTVICILNSRLLFLILCARANMFGTIREMKMGKINFPLLSFLAVFSFSNGLLRQNPRPNETNPSTASEFRRRQGNGKRIQHLHAEGL